MFDPMQIAYSSNQSVEKMYTAKTPQDKRQAALNVVKLKIEDFIHENQYSLIAVEIEMLKKIINNLDRLHPTYIQRVLETFGIKDIELGR